MISGKAFLLNALAALLASVMAIAFWSSRRRQPSHGLGRSLSEILPTRVEGWTIEDQPIATTPEMVHAVNKLLNYDDAVYRCFSSAGGSIAVYAAYWKPGKMPARLIVGHNPDVCWVGEGWRRTATLNALFTVDGLRLHRGQARCFERNGDHQFVVFWHFESGHLSRHFNYGDAPWWAMFRDLWNDGCNLRQEQLFIRISSTMPLEECFRTNVARAIVAALGPIALHVKPVEREK